MGNDYNIETIVCGKFDRNINIDFKQTRIPTEKIRIGSKNPKNFRYKRFEPIATNGKVIFCNNQTYDIRDFLTGFSKKISNNLIVLTVKERSLILEELIDFDLSVNVFETLYPIFSHIKYISNLNKNYNELKRMLSVVKKMGIRGNSLAHYISNEHLFKIERKLRFKNGLDQFFALAYNGGYQEVFKLKEEREDRVVLAFDFNSMYAACLEGDFVEPKSVKYENFRKKNITTSQLYSGLYKVRLRIPCDSFFREFHPFKYRIINKSFYFNLEQNQEIELLLFKNEIEYYQKFFHEINILEGFYSKKTIKHPLIKNGEKLYKDRKKYKNDRNDLMHNLCKFKLVTMHSSTNQKKFKKLHFKTKDEIIRYLSLKYDVDFPKELSSEEKLLLIQDNKYFHFKKIRTGYKAKLIDFNGNETIYSLSAQIIATARVKMVKTIERFLRHSSVEICYSNIDSLHISIFKDEVDNFLLKHSDIISDKLGDLKIQAISDKGYWFDIGRYWLIKDKSVILFKNILFNHKSKKTKFSKNRELKFICKGEFFSYVKSIYVSIDNAFSYHKKINIDDEIDRYNYNRYYIVEVFDLNVAGDTYNNEILKSKKIKMDLYNKIATVGVL
jgi:hypothetical protein